MYHHVCKVDGLDLRMGYSSERVTDAQDGIAEEADFPSVASICRIL